jgi:hydroxymethylglutaryl-CoA reductase (NADPH)
MSRSRIATRVPAVWGSLAPQLDAVGVAPSDADIDALKVPARGRYDEAARRERLAWLRERSGVRLEALEEMRLVPDRLSRNIENAVGAVEVPVGIAGPLLVHGEAVRGVCYAPLATTEGALVASASRGATALTRAGGVTTRVLGQRMTRSPAFELATPEEAFTFARWAASQLPALREQVRHVSRHARLLSVESVIIGRVVHLVFAHQTGDAAGQNMTTATTWHACQWMLAQLPALGLRMTRFMIEGNLSSDKKVALHAGGRGFAVAAECVLDGETLRRVLKVSPRDMLEAFEIGRAGAERAGMIAYNVNVANVVAAIFTATGQDIGCVHESSVGSLELGTARVGGADAVRARLELPGLALGTVGGGTHLPAQRALLEAMGCAGEGSAPRLAELVGGFALALDLSTLAAVASGEFAGAHERLGRNRPVEPLAERDFDAAYFARVLRRHTGDDTLEVERVEAIASDEGASIVGELTARRFGRRVGLLHRRLHHAAGPTDVVVKVKALDAEVLLMMQGIAQACGGVVAEAHRRFRDATGFVGCHLRELAVYEQRDPRFTRHVPVVYDVLRDEAREGYAVTLERLDGVRLMDSADDVGAWTSRDVEAALRGIGTVHAVWMGRERELLRAPWLGIAPSAARMSEARPLWEALADHAADELPALMGGAELRRQRAVIARLPDWWARLEAMPRTLVHHDFNPRNLGLRDTADGPRLCAWDWELATLHVPQRDAAELLAFVLDAGASRDELLHYLELHRRALAEAGGGVPDAATWREGFALSLRDLLVNRFALYLMGHAFRQYGFLERSLGTLRHLIDLELERP